MIKKEKVAKSLLCQRTGTKNTEIITSCVLIMLSFDANFLNITLQPSAISTARCLKGICVIFP